MHDWPVGYHQEPDASNHVRADSGAIISFANIGYLGPDKGQMSIYFSAFGGATLSWVAYLSGGRYNLTDSLLATGFCEGDLNRTA